MIIIIFVSKSHVSSSLSNPLEGQYALRPLGCPALTLPQHLFPFKNYPQNLANLCFYLTAVPQPHKRDSLLQKVRASYDTVSQKAGEAAAYPGDWLYSTWSESDLKEWLDERGYPAPQPTTRDKLIASVRRNSRVAGLKMSDLAASASKSAADATQTLSDKLLESWSDSQIKEWADKNGIKVPQVSPLPVYHPSTWEASSVLSCSQI